MLIDPKPHLSLAVSGPHPRSTNFHATTTERHLAVLVTVPDRGPVRIVLALQAHDVIYLLFHQLGQHAEPDADTQREQALLRCPDQLAQRFLDALREHSLLHGRLRDRYVATHGGSSFDLWRITANAPIGSGRGGGTAVTSKFYEPRGNLLALAGDKYFSSRVAAPTAQVVGEHPSRDLQQGAARAREILILRIGVWPSPGNVAR
jgi:hypothetical protein